MNILLNDEIVEVLDSPCDQSLLEYLRETKKLRGTKEGCASGDCGACTVIVGEQRDGDVHYSTVNSCITPLAAMRGRHLITVEHLSSETALHPAQQAMLECHGSQCGFCTPGFVMSLANLHENTENSKQNTREEVCEAISGNLCRCTGYRPIIEAGLSMYKHASSKALKATLETSASLSELQSSHNEQDSAIPYYHATTIEQCLSLLASHPEAKLIAGGTDLMLEYTQRFASFPALIDVHALQEIRGIELKDQHYRIGAACTYADLDNYFSNSFAEFKHLLQRIAAQQVRNRGTIGGNICNASPIADLPPLLLVFDARLSYASSTGTSSTGTSSTGELQETEIDSFYLGYKKTKLGLQDLLCHISFDADLLNHFFRFYKVSKRIEDDISTVMLAVRFQIEDEQIVDARVAYGGIAAIPLRLKTVENILRGASLNDSNILPQLTSEIKQVVKPLSDVRASSEYRKDLACSLLEKAWLEAAGKPAPCVTKASALELYHA